MLKLYIMSLKALLKESLAPWLHNFVLWLILNKMDQIIP